MLSRTTIGNWSLIFYPSWTRLIAKIVMETPSTMMTSLNTWQIGRDRRLTFLTSTMMRTINARKRRKSLLKLQWNMPIICSWNLRELQIKFLAQPMWRLITASIEIIVEISIYTYYLFELDYPIQILIKGRI